MTTTDLVQHFERHLGAIVGGWKSDAAGNSVPFQVVRFERGPHDGAGAIATLGLSHHLLSLGEEARVLRQELVAVFPAVSGPQSLPGVLQRVGQDALATHRAYVRGEVIGPRGPLVVGSQLEALYVAAPIYFPDSFHVFRVPGADPVVIAWLVPIARSEAAFVRTHGWSAFEDELVRHDPDMTDLRRTPVV